MPEQYRYPSALSPYRALDLTDEKGFLCGKILADLGVDVIKVERPGGDPDRHTGPFYHDIPDPQKSLHWLAFNASKRSITLDIESSGGQENFKKLVRNADFVIESSPPGYLDSLGLGYPVLGKINPRIIMTSITPFGQSGPYKDYKSSDIVSMAMGGLMYTLGDPDRPPVRVSAPQAYVLAGAEAAVGTLIAHHYRELMGEGQHVDTSIQESVVLALMESPMLWEFQKVNERRLGSVRRMATFPGGERIVWPCKDGYVTTMPVMGGMIGAATSKGLVELADAEGLAPDFLKEIDWPKLDMREMTMERLNRLLAPIGEFFKRHTKAELHEMAFSKKIMLYPVNTVRDIMEDTQLRTRDFWVKVEHPELGTTITYPGAFARLSETPCRLRRAPLIGEHNEEISRELLSQQKPAPEIEKHLDSGETGKRQVFSGLKVVEFAWVAAGPWIGKYLAEQGAEVIHVETSLRPDVLRYSPPYKDSIPGPDRTPQPAIFNNDKKGITLNLQNPQGKEIAKRLVSWADVVIENYSPGTMERLGLDYETLKKVNPQVVMLSSSNQGQTGPHASQGGFGWHLSSFMGFYHLTGWPDRDPCWIRGAYTDVGGARFGLVSLLAALDYRRRTGRGQYIDLSQYEAVMQFLAPMILDYSANGRVAKRDGNRCPIAAPHGAYSCQGKDRWCAIAIFTEAEWKGFCKAIGNPSWTKDPKFATLSSRKANEEELDRLVGEWTCNFTAEQVMTMMQKAGVAAGVLQTCEDLHADPQLKHRNHFQQLEHPVIGKHNYFTGGFRLSKTPAEMKKPSPCVGEHNEYVYTKILGMSDKEFVEFLQADVFK